MFLKLVAVSQQLHETQQSLYRSDRRSNPHLPATLQYQKSNDGLTDVED
jgi:hypothetical protein